MSFLGALKSSLLKAGRTTLTVVTYPVVKPTEILMNAIIQNILNSIFKGLIATVLVALTAFSGVVPVSTDPATVFVWGLLVTAVHALQTLLQHLTGTAPAATAAQVAKATAAIPTGK